MGNFFGSIYCIFEDFFGIELANYLWGVASPDSTSNSFIGIGLWMSVISLAMVLLYYYGVNHPKLCNWWGWGIFLIANAGLNFFVGWQMVLRDNYDGLMVRINPATGNTESLGINTSDILCFGVSNMILSIFAFIIFSFIFKWWSSNCSRAPF